MSVCISCFVAGLMLLFSAAPVFSSNKTLDQLLQDLEGAPTKLLIKTAEEIARFGPEIIPDLIHILETNATGSPLGIQAAMAKMGNASVVPLGKILLGNNSTMVKGYVVDTFVYNKGDIGPALPALIEMTKSRNETLRREVPYVFYRHYFPRADVFDGILRVLGRESDYFNMIGVDFALDKYIKRNSTIVEYIAGRTDAEEEDVASGAAKALGIVEKDTTPTLMRLLYGASGKKLVRVIQALALRKGQAKEAVPYFNELGNSRNSTVQFYARCGTLAVQSGRNGPTAWLLCLQYAPDEDKSTPDNPQLPVL